jgi:hypothetical protein
MKRITLLFFSLLAVTFFVNLNCTEKKGSMPSSYIDQESPKGMIFLQHHNTRFREGLAQHNLLDNTGYRLHNTGLKKHKFGDQWANSPELAVAKESGQFYYIDRISGGMPFQSLDGIEEIANKLKDDPHFLGFQVHEWGNSPIHDYHRINRLLLDKGLHLDQSHFSAFEGRTETPYFSAGDYSVYKKLYEPLHSLADIERYLERYFKQIIKRTAGQVMSVTGYAQLYHAAFRLGAKNVMPEIGNQVPLTALQIAFARGAARQYEKPFGVYYEPWGGSPFGGYCALDFSPWFPDTEQLQNVMYDFNVGQKYGSSRSLQRRLLFYSWLAGATYWGEEWGAENYFSNWRDYPLTEYGKIIKEFLAVSTRFSQPQPVVPAALIMPPGTFGVDIRYIAGKKNTLYQIAPPDSFHIQLSAFAADILAANQPKQKGGDAGNLTPSPWISSFDVLSAEASTELLQNYKFLVYFNKEQADKSPLSSECVQVFRGANGDSDNYIQMLDKLLPYRVQGNVGTAHARSDGDYLLGIFNNLGITKTAAGEVADPNAGQTATIQGHCENVRFLVGSEFAAQRKADSIELNIPAGEVVLLSFPKAGAN